MMRIRIWPLAAVALVLSGSGQAADSNAPQGAKSFRDLLDCRKLPDPQERLACFDRQAAALAEASERHEIVVADKAEVQQTRRKLFGFSLPASTILGDEGDPQETKRLETTVVSARRGRDGAWIVSLAESGTWEQTDSKALALSPKAGQKVVLTKGSLGSYFASIDGQAALKMRRIQ